MGVALALVGPSIVRGMGGTRLKATTRQIASTLRLARSLAVTNKAVISVDFDLEQGAYSARALKIYAPPRQIVGTPPPDAWGNPAPAADQSEGETGGQPSLSSLPTGKHVPEPLRLLSFSENEAFQTQEGQAFILFFPKGTSTGGTLQIGEPERTTSMFITVDPITGLVSIAEGEQW